ncbi:hypothetical protein ACJJTC_001442 [Scirpophaga incertulas]
MVLKGGKIWEIVPFWFPWGKPPAFKGAPPCRGSTRGGFWNFTLRDPNNLPAPLRNRGVSPFGKKKKIWRPGDTEVLGQIQGVPGVEKDARGIRLGLKRNKNTVNHKKKNQDWFDESDSEIRRLVERSRLALGGAIDARHRSSIQRDLKVKIRGVKDSWWRHKAEELQWLADTSQTAKFFEGLKCVYGLRTKKTSPVYSPDKTKRAD